jgi:hypothetical protein
MSVRTSNNNLLTISLHLFDIPEFSFPTQASSIADFTSWQLSHDIPMFRGPGTVSRKRSARHKARQERRGCSFQKSWHKPCPMFFIKYKEQATPKRGIIVHRSSSILTALPERFVKFTQ